MIELVVAKFPGGLDHARRVREQVCAGRVAINQKTSVSDLNVEPVHRDVQYTGKFLCAEQVGEAPPSRSLLGKPFEAGAQADALDRFRQHFVGAIR